jgi:hypothetical protein
MALVSTLLVLLLMGALVFGFLAVIAADQQASGINRDQTQAYAAAHAGLEKLTADLGGLFIGGNFSPSGAQITALTTTPPVLPGFTFIAPGNLPGYTITPGALKVATVPSGPFQGLIGLITPYVINVTARSNVSSLGAAEARMRRELQTVAVPVFQFGIFSDNDLSFFAGPNFDFGGRVHTNQNAYVAQDGSATLTLREVFTAVGEVVRTHLANGVSISASGHRGYVRIATTGGSNPTFRNLSCGSQGGNCGGGTQEGSVNVATVPPSTLQTVNGLPTMVLVSGNTRNEPKWTNVSTGSYANRLRNGATGGRRLDLPLVADGATSVDLIRRPSLTVPDTQVVLDQRFFAMASLRVLLSDRASDISGLQTVTAAPPVDLARLALDSAYRADPNGLGTAVTWVNSVPLAVAGTYGTGTAGYLYRVPPGTPLQSGFLKIERQTRDGVWSDVTVEILNRGFTGRNLAGSATWNSAGTTCASNAADDPSPNALIRLQRVRDNPLSGYGNCGRTSGSVWSTDGTNYLPLALYDAREGARRDDPSGQGSVPLFGGVMHYAELDVNNLRLWLATYPDTMDVTGFVVYFSDRRGNKNLGPDLTQGTRAGADGILFTADDFADDLETGELGFEDLLNPASAQSVSNGLLDTGEDINGNGVLDLYGGSPRLYPVAATAYRMATVPAWVPATGATGAWVAGAATGLATTVPVGEARVNPQIFFRRAFKLVNGGFTTGNLRLPANGTQGLTVATENPIYIQGNYNAPNAAGNAMGTTPGTDHVSAAVIADAVTFLSNNFNDIRSFMSPHDAGSSRDATTTWYRVAVISGKGLNFPRPTSNTSNDHTDFGTDGGAHNFLRYIEDWTDQTLNYRGSIISLYLNRQATGIYKCCNVVYSPPTRGYNFDTDFLTPALLPPRTPMFRDINTLTFRQLLRPNQ